MGLLKTAHLDTVRNGYPLVHWEKLFLFVTPSYAALWLFTAWHATHTNNWSWGLFFAMLFFGIGIIVAILSTLWIRLKYPLRWKDSMRFYLANAKRRYPGDWWMQFWLISYRVVTGA